MIKGRRTPPRQQTKRVWRKIHLRDWRESQGLSVEGLAEMSGVSPGLISLIENRKSAGSPETLEKLADTLGISIGDLLDIKPDSDRIVARAWIKPEDQARFDKAVELIDGEPITKT